MPPSSRDVVARIEDFNAGREPERLALKYKEMSESSFAFFRGTAHLYWEDLAAAQSALPDGPLVWACGDLHFENFGSFQGDNGLSYFDINDFDDAALGSIAWEVSRFVTSVYVASPALGMNRDTANDLAAVFLDAYQAALADGKSRWVERTTATGMIQTLLKRVSARTRATLMREHTILKNGRRVIRYDKHALPPTAEQREKVTRELDKFAATQPDPKFFRVLDLARRASGLGSLGLDRYIVLVRGDGGSNGHALLDAKEVAPSSLARFAPVPQPKWRSEPDRVVAIQQRMQAVSPAMLHAKSIRRRGYVLREIQPSKDRLRIEDAKGKRRHFRSAVEVMGQVTAWAQLRSSGREGSAIADDLIAFAGRGRWKKQLLSYGRAYAKRVELDYKHWRRSRRLRA
ncbi:MAG TPA: DUF2252 family protein [Gemmatimonadaceae bacterium]